MNRAVELADDLYVEGKLSGDPTKMKPEQLPASCAESARRLQTKRAVFEAFSVFPPRRVDTTIRFLNQYGDENLRHELAGNEYTTREMVRKYIHCQ
jgi:glutamine synthetase